MSHFKLIFSGILLLLLLHISSCGADTQIVEEDIETQEVSVVYINSYHKGYQWSDGIEEGILSAFGAYDFNLDLRLPDGRRAKLHLFRMDSKFLTSEEELKTRAAEVYKKIIERNPSLIISSDDNASKYIIREYFYNSSVPVVFCGLNWDATVYGFPTDTITGMVEVAPIQQAIDTVQGIKSGTRLGYLGADVYSEQKEIENYINVLGIEFEEGFLVNTMAEWKMRYSELQNKVDILVLVNNSGIVDWVEKEVISYIHQETIIPSITTSENMAPYSAVTFGRLPQEQGWWAGKRAIEILEGAKVEDIPVAKNTDFRLIINPVLLEQSGLELPDDLTAGADVTEF